MKKIISILLMFAFLVQMTSQLWILAAFKINQPYVAANLCINRFETIPLCKGSCYLENQLNEDQKQQQKFPDLKTKEINLFCQDKAAALPEQVLPANTKIIYSSFISSFAMAGYYHSVFHPPAAAPIA